MDPINIPGFATWKRAIENRLRALETGSNSDPWHILGDPGEPALTASFTNYTPGGVGVTFPTARFRKIGTNVQVQGLVQSVGGINPIGAIIANLPIGYRPTKQIINVVTAFGSVQGERAARIDAASNGNLILNDSGFTNPTTFLFISLNMWYPVV